MLDLVKNKRPCENSAAFVISYSDYQALMKEFGEKVTTIDHLITENNNLRAELCEIHAKTTPTPRFKDKWL